MLLWCTVLGYVVQMQAAKLGVVTGKHLAEHCRCVSAAAQVAAGCGLRSRGSSSSRSCRGVVLTRAGVLCCDVCREQFSPLLRYGLWIMAEIAIIGSDIQEVIGSAIALLLLSRGAVPLWGGVLLSVALSFTMLLVERCGIRKLEALFGVLISIMVASFAVSWCADQHHGKGIASPSRGQTVSRRQLNSPIVCQLCGETQWVLQRTRPMWRRLAPAGAVMTTPRLGS